MKTFLIYAFIGAWFTALVIFIDERRERRRTKTAETAWQTVTGKGGGRHVVWKSNQDDRVYLADDGTKAWFVTGDGVSYELTNAGPVLATGSNPNEKLIYPKPQ